MSYGDTFDIPQEEAEQANDDLEEAARISREITRQMAAASALRERAWKLLKETVPEARWDERAYVFDFESLKLIDKGPS